MALDLEMIAQQIELLKAYRRTLAHLLQQAAQFGGEVFAPPQTAHGITEARTNIARIKTTLLDAGIEVADEPNDHLPPAREPAQPQRTGGDMIGGDKVIGEQRIINTGGGDYAEGTIDKRQGGPFIEGSVVLGDVIGQQTIHYHQAAVTPLDRQQQRNRRAMLAKVKSIWIEGLLEQSLAKELRIALDLAEQPNAIDLPMNAFVQQLNHPPRPLPSNTPIIQLFDQMGGALLILGAPGAGKTTLLLELARDLIVRAEHDQAFSIPVVFNLSSWATKQRPLREWLIEELSTKYNIPRKLAQAWMDTDLVLPLLDGLDEVAGEQREACVEMINAYHQEHGLVPLAVCSRVADYQALKARLRLQGAVLVQPLTPPQVDTYLERAGQQLAGIRTALLANAELRELLTTPLMLSIALLAYAGTPAAEFQRAGASNAQQQHLFDVIVQGVEKGTRIGAGKPRQWASIASVRKGRR